MMNITASTTSYNETAKDESALTLLKEDFSLFAPTVSGCISVFSSALIIFIIFQSRSKLSIIYHRIMFGMSCCDILSSLAMAFTTLPMPRSLPPGLVDRGWAGIRAGTVGTCAFQGFAFHLGIVGMYTYNAMLCFYNALAIAFRLKKDTIVRYFEPFIHLIPWTVGLGMAVPPLFFIDDMVYRPTTTMWCTVEPGVRYDAPEAEICLIKYYDLQITIIIASLFLIIITSFLLMVSRVYQIERQFTKIRLLSSLNRSAQSLMNAHKNTKVLLKQVLAYTIAFLLTLSFPLIRSFMPNEPDWAIRGMFLLTPLQGFFNLLIFLSHKVYNYRRVHDDVSICHVIKLVLNGDAEEVVLFSRISLLRYDHDRRAMEAEMMDELDNVEHFSFFDKQDKENQLPSVQDVFIDKSEERDELDDFMQYLTKFHKEDSENDLSAIKIVKESDNGNVESIEGSARSSVPSEKDESILKFLTGTTTHDVTHEEECLSNPI